VNFNALKAHPLRLNHYLAQLEAYSPDSHPALFIDMRQRLAYWINAFNAIAMRLVLDAYPINAVTEIANYRASARYKLGGVPYSLDAIESRITREFSHIPEAYWALSDLTEDAPPLANRAYEAPALTEQLAFQARRYVGQPDTFEVASDCSSITISPYVQRFQPLLIAYIQKEKVGLPPDVSSYLALYADADTRGRLHRSCTATVYYKPYDTRVRAVVPLLK
jgi:hypothetical protein